MFDEKAYQKEYRKRNRDKIRANINLWKEQNPEKAKNYKEYKKQYQKEYLKTDKAKEYRLMFKYGITMKQKTEMFNKQEGKCSICSINMETVYKAHVDHNHITNKVRGLLCQKCNMGLGIFNDNKEILRNAIKYIEQYDGN